MEVDGKEFLRNVGIEQDKERLIKEQEKLEELKRVSIKRESNYQNLNTPVNDEDSAYVDLSIGSETAPKNPNSQANNVDDIILQKTSSNNKKKYVVLGIGLILLFIITVLIIRLISNNKIEDQLNDESPIVNEVAQEDILNKIDSNGEYQKVIDRKKALEESAKVEQEEQSKLMNEIQVQKSEIENVPLVLDIPKIKAEVKRDLFELEQESKKIREKQVQLESEFVEKASEAKEKEKILSKPKDKVKPVSVSEKNFTKNTATLVGYYIQIGAFTKAPNNNLLKSIVSKGYSYKVHTLTIKGKLYNKVLVGSYKSRSDATKSLNQVKKDFNNPNAYILKF